MIINCIIIDDEPLARKGLREYISEVDRLNLVGEYDSALKAAERLAQPGVHLVFLDVQMPKLTGLELMRTMRDLPPVIFTTAYPDHAVEGFELNAIDYLLKPISFERFLKAVLKVQEHYALREERIHTSVSTPDHFFIKADNKLVRIAYNEVLFAEGLQNYVCIHTTGKKYITYLTFKAVEEYLPAAQFLQVHKSYIIALDKVTGIDASEILLGEHRIPVGRTFRDQALEVLLKGKFLKR